MAISRRELECVLDFPERRELVDFLMTTFQCDAVEATQCKVDLVTLLTTAAMLAQGPMADKARFVFALVDLDTEDDIVEAELALVITTCCNGLRRLGLMEGEEMAELDALAIAYEAFEFVELEDGDKMTFSMFMKWCVFHPRPAALFERISCLFSMCDAVRKIKQALQQRESQEGVSLDTYRLDRVQTRSVPRETGEICVILGPVIGCVSPQSARVLIECDAEGHVTCVATDRLSGDEISLTQRVKTCRPTTLTLTGLTPGRTYDLSLQVWYGVHWI